MKKDNVRTATNEVFFATLGAKTSWKVVKDTDSSTQAILVGDTALMLEGIKAKKPRFDELGVTVLGKVTDTGLIVDVTDGIKPAAK